MSDYEEKTIKLMVQEGGRLLSEIESLQAENAKLRELVRDMWFWHYEGYIDNVPQEEQTEHIDGVMRRMRKLGCEVDE